VKTIHHVFDAECDANAVWAALTEPAQMAGWWGTKVETPPAAVGARVVWTFVGNFNPVMEIVALDTNKSLTWRCIAGHDNWQDGTFRFEIAPLDDGRTRVRFWQDYAVELSDDDFGIYGFNWGYYLESLRLLVTTGAGKPFVAL
jgi:uncharacterized protein YndB with AHSA1/START domain